MSIILNQQIILIILMIYNFIIPIEYELTNPNPSDGIYVFKDDNDQIIKLNVIKDSSKSVEEVNTELNPMDEVINIYTIGNKTGYYNANSEGGVISSFIFASGNDVIIVKCSNFDIVEKIISKI